MLMIIDFVALYSLIAIGAVAYTTHDFQNGDPPDKPAAIFLGVFWPVTVVLMIVMAIYWRTLTRGLA